MIGNTQLHRRPQCLMVAAEVAVRTNGWQQYGSDFRISQKRLTAGEWKSLRGQIPVLYWPWAAWLKPPL